MMLDCGPRCKESRTMYQLEVKRERDGVRLKTQMQGECRTTYKLEVKEHDGVRLWRWM